MENKTKPQTNNCPKLYSRPPFASIRSQVGSQEFLVGVILCCSAHELHLNDPGFF